MPTYSYICDKEDCQHEFEKRLRMSQVNDPTEEPCPECNEQGTVRRKITNARFRRTDDLKRNTDEGFREVISKIKEHHPLNDIPDNY